MQWRRVVALILNFFSLKFELFWNVQLCLNSISIRLMSGLMLCCIIFKFNTWSLTKQRVGWMALILRLLVMQAKVGSNSDAIFHKAHHHCYINISIKSEHHDHVCTRKLQTNINLLIGTFWKSLPLILNKKLKSLKCIQWVYVLSQQTECELWRTHNCLLHLSSVCYN